jgi:hypothetical protein
MAGFGREVDVFGTGLNRSVTFDREATVAVLTGCLFLVLRNGGEVFGRGALTMTVRL